MAQILQMSVGDLVTIVTIVLGVGAAFGKIMSKLSELGESLEKVSEKFDRHVEMYHSAKE